ncbi:thiol-activated cytolysin family protein [Emticicia oligotrophica]|uniref:thiol-activated cytolysin family protein n=1 Tax=Emticicia oligotrophica TaxID=312279 RepID=UPI00273A8EC2|nr:thiol-activated cytolysin family protein [Emticicia oligotrophica]
MKKLLLIVTIFTISCQQSVEPQKPTDDINALFRGIPELTKPETTSRVKIEDKTTNNVPSDGSSFNCNDTKWKLSKPLEVFTNTSFDVTNPNISDLYPSAIIKLKELNDRGVLTSIGSLSREQITLTSTLPNTQSKNIKNPANSTVKAAVDEIITSFVGSVPADLNYVANEAYSTEQGLLELGINANWGLIGTNVKFKVSEKVQDKSVMLLFTQKYHTVSVNYPGSPADFFGNDINVDNLRAITSTDNPLGYINQVTYGRIVFAKLTYTGVQNITQKELALKLRTGIKTSGIKFSEEDRKVFSKSKIEISILGGDADKAVQTINTGKTIEETLQNIDKYIKSDANNPKVGIPIAYTVRYISNNNLFSTSGNAEYTERNCIINPKEVTIKSIRFTILPSKDKNGNNWDAVGTYPDVYFTISTTTGQILKTGADRIINDVTDLMVSQGKVFFDNVNYRITDFNTPYDVDAYDDDLGGDEYMSYARFVFGDYTKITATNTELFPSLIKKKGIDPKTGLQIEVELELEWK